MKKKEYIERQGEEGYERYLAQRRAHYKAHREQEKARNKKYHEEHKEDVKARNKKYREEHPEQVEANNREINRKSGKYYDKNLKDNHTGLRGARGRIRMKHANKYRPFKDIIAPDSQLHHEWVPCTAEYRGMALVEKEPHQYGIVDVIHILAGEITLLTEEEVKRGK